jgi:Flp pilus assembly protein TadG
MPSARSGAGRRKRQRGQSVVEFAAILFPLIFITLLAIDGGGVFLAWIGMNGLSRDAANVAATHPTAWGTPGDGVAQAQFEAIVSSGTTLSRCPLPTGTTVLPSFPSGTAVGAAGAVNTAVVRVRCRYTFVTPFLNDLAGGGMWVDATTAMPIRVGAIAGLPISSSVPIPSTSPSPSASVDPSPSASVDPSSSPTACVVPDFAIGATRSDAAGLWSGAGFSTIPTFDPDSTVSFPPSLRIGAQSLTAGTAQSCSASIELKPACVVPNFVNNVARGNAQSVWAAAFFTTTVNFSPDNLTAFPGAAMVGGQSLVAGALPGCGAQITLTKN